MRVQLPGINTVKKKLASGERKTYYYAWKGGPRIKGEFGSDEFIASYHEERAKRVVSPEGTLQSVLDAYQRTPAFIDLAARTRADYVKQIKRIEAEFGEMELDALTDRRTRNDILTWRDNLAHKSRRQADYAYAVLALILAWAFNRGLVLTNPCERGGKVYRSKRVENIWSQDDEAAFLKSAPEHLKLAFMMALWTGQRQGDLLKLPWSAYDGERVRLKQSKTGARVSIPVGAPLKAMLDVAPKKAVLILTTTNDTAWTESGFRASWRTAVQKAGITGVTFHDLRGTAVTRLALADCSESEIATITGHSLKDVGAILDAHYLRRDDGLATSAIRKREAHEAGTKAPN